MYMWLHEWYFLYNVQTCAHEDEVMFISKIKRNLHVLSSDKRNL